MTVLYYIQKPDELYHYGVKGMKWGVRHDPENSGLTRREQRQAKKDEKHIKKVTKYRDRLSKRAQFFSNVDRMYARQNAKSAKNVKNEGVKSQEYLARARYDYQKRADSYSRRNNGASYGGVDAFIDAIVYDANAGQRVLDLQREYSSRSRKQYAAARKWTQTSKKVMETPVSALTTKKDIKSVYKSNKP